MKAIVVEGGAMRGIFAAGVLDAYIETDFFPYEFAIGVSAGTSNLANYLSRQQKRSYDVITKLATKKQFFNPVRFIKKGHLIDIQWLLKESERVCPLNKKQLFSSIPLFTSITNVATGKAEYHQLDHRNITYLLEATSAMPIAYRSTPCTLHSCHADGGISDSIPVIEAYKRGAKDITVIFGHRQSFKKQRSFMNQFVTHSLSHSLTNFFLVCPISFKIELQNFLSVKNISMLNMCKFDAFSVFHSLGH